MAVPLNPSKSQLRYGFEANPGVGDVSSWTDCRFRSESLGAEFPDIADDSIALFGEEPPGAPTKVNTGNSQLDLAVHVEDQARLLAAYYGKSATPVESPTGVWTHKLAVTESAVSFGMLGFEVSRDRGRPTVYPGVDVGQLAYNLAARQFLGCRAQLVFGRFHHWDVSTKTAGSGTGTLPVLRGFHAFAELELATADAADVIINIVTDGNPVTLNAQLGTGGTPGSNFTVPRGLDSDGQVQWVDVKVGAGDTLLGDVEIPVQIAIPGTSGTYAGTDVYRVPRRRPVWSQSLADPSLLNEIAAEIKVDGVKFKTRQIDITLGRGVALDENIGGRFVDDRAEQADRVCFGTISRRALKELSMENRLIRAQSFELDAIAKGPVIGATGVRRSWRHISKNCRLTGRTVSVAGRTNVDERFEFRAHPSTDPTYPAASTTELVLSAASLT